MRNINMLLMVKNAPAMPPPKAIFDMLICGAGVSSRMPQPLAVNLSQNLRLQDFPDAPPVTRDLRFQCRRAAQRLMDPSKVVANQPISAAEWCAKLLPKAFVSLVKRRVLRIGRF